MIRLIPAFLVAFTVSTFADSSVIWPPQQPPAGTPVAEFPVPRVELNRFQEHVDDARKRPIDLLFDGDSITDTWQAGDRGLPVWKERYGALNAIDFGVSGDRIQNLLWRLDHGELVGLHPKLIVLMIGTNNIGNSKPEEIAAGIRLAVDTYRKDCPDAHILLLGIFPRSASAADPIRATVKEINGLISKFDDGKNVTYLDIGEKFLTSDGTLSPEIMPDALHPSTKGFQIWADAIQSVVDQYCPKSAASASATPSPAITSPEPTLSWPYDMTAPQGVTASTFPIPHVDWLYHFQGDVNKLKQGPYDLIFDGDSITDFWQGTGRDVLKERYGKIKLLDVAISGDQVQHVLWRLHHGDLEGQDPKLIMLMIGTNNGGQDPKDIAAGIKLVLEGYETICPHAHILLLGVFPRDEQAETSTRKWVKAINAIISGFGSDRVTYMDIGDKFLQPDGTLTKEIMPDSLHPSAKGYTIWADAIQPVIDQYFPDAKK